ncbi:putative MATE efflux family protein subfamily [Apodospora peruviana]|uniref:MATE efflux family protein subfamily n=1 Tax=Apodospora peruviana TaxID=516989 RepID=A0AAE0IL18_9PEZI|nr:putative MATE efflux family protein subfamily [Apodospora peruviana]
MPNSDADTEQQCSPYHHEEDTTCDETSPLLPSSTDARPRRSEYVLWLDEMWFLTKAAVPVILAYILQNSLQTASVLIVGRLLSSEALAVAAFSYMFAMATAWLIALGGTSALDTLASTSFTLSAAKGGNSASSGPGRSNLGILLQRGIVVLSSFYLGVAIIWVFFSEGLFRLLHQPEVISVGSARFLALLAPGGLGYVWFECMKKFLQAQGLYRAGTYVLLITAPFNVVLNYIFVKTLGFGLMGAPVATGISYWLSFCLLVGYYAFFVHGKARDKEEEECWTGLHPRRACTNMGPFAKLAFLGVIHVGTEWWAFEIVALAAGRLGTLPLAAQSVVMTADQIINTIPFGLGVAESARLGNMLGAGRPMAARRSAHSAALLSVLFGSVISITLLATRHKVGGLFNDDDRVIELVAEIMPYVALFQIADGLNGSCGGALRGMGRQWVGALVNCVSYYAGALPGGIWFAFRGGWGLAGLWMGQCVALSLVGILEWIVVAQSNWVEEVRKAAARLEEDQQDTDASLGAPLCH